MQSAYLYINSKKLPFSRGFNLISNLGKDGGKDGDHC